MTMFNENYRFEQVLDTNLTADYEVDKWKIFHCIREYLANALDAVRNDTNMVKLDVENGYVKISDSGKGFSLSFARRIGASSKKSDTEYIGMFGEGSKMGTLVLASLNTRVTISSQDWMIVPRLVPDEDEPNIQVLVFDVYRADRSIIGTQVCIEAKPEVLAVIQRIDEYFLHFSTERALYGSMQAGIYAKTEKAMLFNKGVYIKDINTMFSYAFSLSELNRDRDLIDSQVLRNNLRNIWSCVDNPELIQAYLLKAAEIGDSATDLKEFTFTIFPGEEIEKLWVHCFYELFGEKAVLSTNAIASIEAALLGFKPVKLEHYAITTLECMHGILKDTNVIRTDYAFTLADTLTPQEQHRLHYFKQVATMLGLEMPENIKVFARHAKSDNLLGYFDEEQDSIYIKQELLKDELSEALDTFLHELNHRETGAEDYSRAFADGLSELLARTAIELANKVGLPLQIKLTKRGFQLPGNFQFSADNLEGSILTIGDSIRIQAGGYTLKAEVPGVHLKPYSASRSITFYKGRFYINVPASIRSQLPEEIEFRMAIDAESI